MSEEQDHEELPVKQVLPQEVDPRTHWICKKCGHLFTRLKPHRKRKEYYKNCPECGEKIPNIAL